MFRKFKDNRERLVALRQRLPDASKGTLEIRAWAEKLWTAFCNEILDRGPFVRLPSTDEIAEFVDALASIEKENQDMLGRARNEEVHYSYSSVRTAIFQIMRLVRIKIASSTASKRKELSENAMSTYSDARILVKKGKCQLLGKTDFRKLLNAFHKQWRNAKTRTALTYFRSMVTTTTMHEFGLRSSSLMLANGVTSRGDTRISSVDAALSGKPKLGGLRCKQIAIYTKETEKGNIYVGGCIDIEFMKVNGSDVGAIIRQASVGVGGNQLMQRAAANRRQQTAMSEPQQTGVCSKRLTNPANAK